MTAAVTVNDSAAKGDGGGNPNETVEAASSTVNGDDKSSAITAAAADSGGANDQAAATTKTASGDGNHSEGANKSESDEASSQIDGTKQAKVKVSTLAVAAAVKSEEVDHHHGGVAGSFNGNASGG